jgi:hypothetical protein
MSDPALLVARRRPGSPVDLGAEKAYMVGVNLMEALSQSC